MSISGEDHVLPAWSNNGGLFEFIVPADYVNPWQDKPIDEFWLTDGEMGCQLEGFTQTALEADPSALTALAMDMVTEYQTLAAEMGYPIDDILNIVENQKEPSESEPVLRMRRWNSLAIQFVLVVPMMKKRRPQCSSWPLTFPFIVIARTRMIWPS